MLYKTFRVLALLYGTHGYIFKNIMIMCTLVDYESKNKALYENQVIQCSYFILPYILVLQMKS